jgi:hypothetical protein
MPNGGRISPIWNCRETKIARGQLGELADRDQRFQQLWEDVSWLIRRDPTNVGQVAHGKQHTRTFKTLDFLAIDIPEIIVTFAIIDQERLVLEVVSVIAVRPQP